MEYEEFEIRCIRTTDAATLLEFIDEEEQIWIPFSQIEDNGEDLKPGYEGPVYITEWIANQKGLL